MRVTSSIPPPAGAIRRTLGGVTLAACAVALAAAAASGCGDDSAAPGGPSPGSPSSFPVTGVVLDSVTDEAVVGARVMVNDIGTTTDTAGRFALRAPATFVALQVYHRGYEDYRRTLSIEPDSVLVLELPPAAPYIWSCRLSGDSVVADVTDLQGRKTILRRDTSGVLAIRGVDTSFQSAGDWKWVPLDYLTYRVRLRVGDGGYDELRWRIFDAKGHVVVRRCAPFRDERPDGGDGSTRNE